jgi:hypothetical protein
MIVKWCERFMLASVALLGAMALVSFGRQVWQAGASPSPDESGPSLTVRSEFRAIYASKGVIDFARAHPAIATNDELIRLVREARLGAWFGVVFRTYLDNCDVGDIAMAIRPGERLGDFGNTRGVLCLLAGKPTGSPVVDRTSVEIEVIEEALMNMEPVEGLRQVLGRGPGRRPADDSMPHLVRTGGSANGAASYSGPGNPVGGGSSLDRFAPRPDRIQPER